MSADCLETDTTRTRTPGRVYLVGAGPGDPGLLTLRGAECLAAADLVLYDGLVNPLLLRHTRGICERTARTRTGAGSVVPQEEINERLITEARCGKTVVRLKGGDPYIFGRGSEEAAALADAGIPFEVVPGITAATGAGEYAGFSLTHREWASAVAFVTGHEDPNRESKRLNFQALAAFPGTLVFYMGLGRLPEICRQLIDSGMSDTTPAAVVCQASLPGQRTVDGTLGNLPKLALQHHLIPPSLIVVGDCVCQREKLNWFERLPLFGVSIGVTRADHQAEEISDQIIRLGGDPVIMPLIEIRPVPESAWADIDETLKHLSEFFWLIFTSVNGVSEFFRHLQRIGLDSRALSASKVAAIGSSTAGRLSEFGIRADLVPEEFRAENLARAIVSESSGSTALWVRASRGRDVLPEILKRCGMTLKQLVVYENRDVTSISGELRQRLSSGRLDWIGLSSPSIARRLADVLQSDRIDVSTLRTKLAAISPVTAQAAEEAGLNVTVTARTFTWSGILDAIISHRSQPDLQTDSHPRR